MNLETYNYQFKEKLDPLPFVSLLGIRGSSAVNQMDIYDDLIIRCIGEDLAEFKASVDPGAYYISHPLNPQGCAKLHCGLWTYCLGEHHSKPALIQCEEVKVDRIDKDGVKKTEDHGWYGINIHSGGPEYLVGRYSAGCQVIQTEEAWLGQWINFFEPLKAALNLRGQTRVPYLLVDRLKAIPVSELPKNVL